MGIAGQILMLDRHRLTVHVVGLDLRRLARGLAIRPELEDRQRYPLLEFGLHLRPDISRSVATGKVNQAVSEIECLRIQLLEKLPRAPRPAIPAESHRPVVKRPRSRQAWGHTVRLLKQG